MAKTIKSYPGMFGQTNHYDEHGKKIGESWPGVFGGTDHYDTHGHRIGHTMPGALDDQIHYDSHGHRVGRSLISFPDTKPIMTIMATRWDIPETTSYSAKRRS